MVKKKVARRLRTKFEQVEQGTLPVRFVFQLLLRCGTPREWGRLCFDGDLWVCFLPGSLLVVCLRGD